MTEPLTDRKRRILQILNEECEAAANDLSTGDVNWRAFGVRTREAACRNDLRDLEWRGLVEQAGMTNNDWRITESGREAL